MGKLKSTSLRCRKPIFRKIRTVWGFQMMVRPDEFVGKHIFIEGSFEDQIGRNIRERVGPGDCVLDIGANVGYFSLLASRCVGSSGKVWSFEPNRELFAVLNRNRELNRADNIMPCPVALSDRPGKRSLFCVDEENMGKTSFRDDGNAGSASEVEECIPLDSMLETLRKSAWSKSTWRVRNFWSCKG